MKKWSIIALVVVFSMIGTVIFAAEMQRAVRASWDPLTAALEKTAKYAVDPNPKTQGQYAEIGAMMEKAQEILLSWDSRDKLKKREENIKKIDTLQKQIDGYQNERISADDAKRSALDSKIQAAKAEILDLQNDSARLEKSVVDELKSWGMSVNDVQKNIMFKSVLRDAQLDSAVVYKNVSDVTRQIGEILSENGASNIDLARRYYSMYIVLIDIVISAQEGFVMKLSDWMPHIDQMIARAQKSYDNSMAKATNTHYNERQKQLLQKNVKLNELSMRAAQKYKELLEKQAQVLRNSISSLRGDREVALDTYQTVTTVGDMKIVLDAGLDLFNSLINMQVPDLQMYDGDFGMQEQLDKITAELSKMQ